MSMSAGPQRKAPAQSFQMPIESVRSITGRGTLVTGRVRQGAVKKGDPVEISRAGGKSTFSIVIGVQVAGGGVDHARAGDMVGLLLRGVDPQEVASGEVLRAR